ncbi:MAG: endonuclease VIII [Halobacteriovoraceae bacterium]|nr:endonuclease VIII [Halobacteriovoraceae bacterium]
MPEGPEIRREADEIEKAISGKSLKKTFFKFERLKEFESVLEGSALLFVQTVGKGFVLHFDCGLSFYGHNQLYGKWLVASQIPGESEIGKRELRASFEVQGAGAYLFSASEMEIVATEEVLDIPFIKRNNGFDILGRDCTTFEVLEFITNSKFQKKSLAALLLDQKFILGMGNYLRSEVLFCSGVNPESRLMDLNLEQKRDLSFWLIEIMNRAYQHKGVTNDLQRERILKSKGIDFESRRFFVFDREDKNCYECNSKIRRIEKSGRRLYFCPKCQKL